MMIRQIVHDENRNLYYDNRSLKDDNHNMDDDNHNLYYDNRIWMIIRHERTIDMPYCVWW